MRRPSFACVLLVAACRNSTVQFPDTGPANYAPLRKVRLYDSGIAYFERSGPVNNNMLGLPIPRSHLDDAVATLVVMATDGTRVTQIGFPIPSSSSKARAWLGLSSKESPSLHHLLSALRGERVSLETREQSNEGTLLSLTDHEATTSKEDSASTAPSRSPSVLLQEPGGSVVRYAESDIRRVTPLDPSIAAALGSAGQALSPHAAQLRTALIAAAQGGELRFGYVSESPTWKMSYRVVMEKNKGRLVGYATVHNDTDEAWDQVRVELSNGEPDSFVAAQASPAYRERRVASRPDGEKSVGQLQTQSADELADGEGESFGEGGGGMGLAGSGSGGGGYAYGSLGVADKQGASSLLQIGNLADQVRAQGQAQSNLYTYMIDAPVSLPPRHSALLPVLSRDIELSRVHLFQAGAETGVHAAYIVNSSEMTLPQGTIAMFSDGGYAGENQLPRMLGGAVRYLPFAPDLDVRVRTERHFISDTPKDLTFDKGRLHVHTTRVSEQKYQIENLAAQPFVLAMQLHPVNNAQVEGAKKLTEGAAEGFSVTAQFDVPAALKHTAKLRITEGIDSAKTPANLSAADVELYLGSIGANTAKRDVLRAALPTVREMSRLQEELRAAAKEDQQLETQVQALARPTSKPDKVRDEQAALRDSRMMEKLLAPLLSKRAAVLARKQQIQSRLDETEIQLSKHLEKLGPSDTKS